MKCGYILLLFALFSQVLPAQTLIPFLAQNGKYGFADESGKMVIAPEFEGHIEPFFEKMLAIDCQKNGETVRLFRSGLVVPNPRLMMHRTLPVLDYDENGERIDSIGHLLAFQVGQNWQIIDIRAGGKIAETHQEDYLKLPKWAQMRGPSLTNGADFRFQHSVLRIFRADGSVNFLDENLRAMLPKDVAAGVVADAQHLIFAESEGRFGVANRNGKTVVAPVFRSLEPSGKTGFFLANKQRDGSTGEKWHCGLVRADGKIVLDTVYSDIEKVDGADLLIVRNVGKTGLFDFEGREIVPIEAEYGYKQDFGFSIFKWPNGGGANLFDRHGKRLLEQNAAEVTSVKFSNKLFFKVKTGGWTSVLDTSMTVLVRDSVENLDLVEADPPLFMVRKNGSQSRLVSVRDAAGRTLVEEKFDHVWSAGWPDGLRFIYLNNLKGIADRRFNEILPPVYEEIFLEEGRRDTFIWAKKKGDALFMAFDKRGIRCADIDNAPEPRRESAFGVIAKMQALPGGGHMATMFDGTQLKWPDSLQNQRVWAAFRSQTGGAVAVGFDPKRITTVLDHRFRNLLPAGFGVPERTANETVLERFQQFGLLVVQKLPDVKPVAMPAPRPKPKPVERTAGAPEVVTSDAPVQEYPIGEGRGMGMPAQKTEPMPGAACGVLDLDGNWILEPKTGVEYLVLSPYLVAEFPAGAQSSSHQFFEKGLRLHRVQQAEKGFFEANWLGRDRFSKEEGNNMKIGRIRKGTTRLAEYAYFDGQGRAITEWIFENGPDFLKSKNLVHIWKHGVYGIRQAVINENGKTIFELGDWMTEDSPRSRGGDNDKWTHLIIQKRRDEILKDTLGRLIPMPQGLMDSTGRIVLPLQFFDLAVREKDRFLTAKTAAGNAVLMTMDGSTIHEFKPGKSSILMQHIGRGLKRANAGPMAVWTENETVLLNDNNAVIRHFDLPFGREVLPEKMAEQFVVLIKNNQKVWADFRSGKLFVE